MAETVETLVRLVAKIVRREAETKAKQQRQQEQMIGQQVIVVKDKSLKTDAAEV